MTADDGPRGKAVGRGLSKRPAGGHRAAVLLSLGVAGVLAAWELGLDFRDLLPSEGGLRVAREFFSRAASPALTYEADFVPEGAPPLWLKALRASRVTVVFAAAAMSLSVVFGMLLGFLASTAWWVDDPVSRGSATSRVLRPVVHVLIRGFIAFLRSVHELLWAVLFLAALGRGNLTAVIAIALPFTGTLAKVFSELIDEAPREPAAALRSAGARPFQVFLFALLPAALPDFAAYAFYRFECALRSSAVLGFFGYPTLGYYLAASFENLHYGEVWTYLYTLLVLVIVVDLWSGALRRSRP